MSCTWCERRGAGGGSRNDGLLKEQALSRGGACFVGEGKGVGSLDFFPVVR